MEATLGTVRKRVPVFIGCTSLNTRETMRQVKFAEQAANWNKLCEKYPPKKAVAAA